MTKKQPPTADECEQILKNKLDEINDYTGDEKSNFIASFTLDLPNSPKIENSEIDNDYTREAAFKAATLEGVKHAKELLIELEIPYIRPNDMFVEMVKSEEQMERIRQDLKEKQQNQEKNFARNKEKRELKEKPKQKEQKRPGQLLRPRGNSKQQKERNQRRERQGKK